MGRAGIHAGSGSISLKGIRRSFWNRSIFDVLLCVLTAKLFGHVRKRLGKLLLAKRQLADCPDLGVLENVRIFLVVNTAQRRWVDFDTYRLQILALLGFKSTTLQSNDFGGRIGIVGYGRAALGAEQAMNIFTGRTFATVLLDWAIDGELVFGDDYDKRWMICR